MLTAVLLDSLEERRHLKPLEHHDRNALIKCSVQDHIEYVADLSLPD